MRFLVCLLLLASYGAAADRPPVNLPPLREQARLQHEWLKDRLEGVLPGLMRKHGVDMWIVACREYAEDPAFFSLVDATTFAARRTTVYVFFDRGPEQGVERLALGGSSQGGLYQVYRAPEPEHREIYLDAQWQALHRIVAERKPKRIALDISRVHAFADGLASGLREDLEAALGAEYLSRVTRAEALAVEYQDIRVPTMLPTYRDMMRIVHWLIATGFSNQVITPGKTTDLDVMWWLRQKTNDLGLGTWFHPSIRVQRPKMTGGDFLTEEKGIVIQRGDVLHVDFGITALRLNTDTQHMAYVLKEGETDVPAGIKAAFAKAQRLQDIHLEQLKVGRTGNDVLHNVIDQMKTEGIHGSVYSHPIGDHGHAAGPLIGLWDRQEGVPGRGDLPVLASSWFSIELSVREKVPEWDGEEVFIGMEEDVAIDAEGHVNWVLQRQQKFHLIR